MAPKPLMTEGASTMNAGPRRFSFTETALLTEIETAFDAACFARFGRDIF